MKTEARARLERARAEGRPYVHGRDLLFALYEGGLLPQWPLCNKVVIVADSTSPVRMYVEQIPTAALLDVAIGADGIEVLVEDKLQLTADEVANAKGAMLEAWQERADSGTWTSPEDHVEALAGAMLKRLGIEVVV